MSPELKKIDQMKVFPKGQVVIPVKLRKKYGIEIGDQIQIEQQANGILLKRAKSPNAKASRTDALHGIFVKYGKVRSSLSKKEIDKATEDMLVEGWNK